MGGRKSTAFKTELLSQVIDEEAKGGAKAKNRGTKRKAEEAPVTPSEQPPTKQASLKSKI